MNSKAPQRSNAMATISLLLFVTVVAYTIPVIQKDGWNFLSFYFNDLLSLTWPGQFNLDFAFYLILSGLWIMWRSKFSTQSILLAILTCFGGMIVFTLYLYVEQKKVKGDLRKLLLGIRDEG